jgi:hypothetical protein
MLDRNKRPPWSAEFETSVKRGPVRPDRGAGQAPSGPADVAGSPIYRLGAASARSRLVVGLALMTAGLVWAIARGLEFYGLSLVDFGYDLDQPPLLLVLLGTWLLYRNRRA